MHSRHAGIEHAPRSITGLNQLHAYMSLSRDHGPRSLSSSAPRDRQYTELVEVACSFQKDVSRFPLFQLHALQG